MDISNSHKIINDIHKNISSSSLFKLLDIYEQLLGVLCNYKEKLRVLKESKSIIEATITVKINSDSKIKTNVKKACIDLAKNEDPEYTEVSKEYNDLKLVIDRLEDLIRIVDRKYKLIEPAFHSGGVLTYEELEREYNR